MSFGLIRRLRYGRPVIVVSGLPRSGTSMAMRMLAAGGLEVISDGAREADEDNPVGYFEDERVKRLGDDQDRAWLRAARGRAVKIISYLLKDLPADTNYQVLFLDRDLDEVMASQRTMLARRGESDATPDEQMKASFAEHLDRARFILRHRPQFDSLELSYREVVASPRQQAERIARFLGRDLDLEAMAAAVDSSLYRNRKVRQPAAV